MYEAKDPRQLVEWSPSELLPFFTRQSVPLPPLTFLVENPGNGTESPSTSTKI